MNDVDDMEITELLTSLRYKTPQLGDLWQPSSKPARRPFRLRLTLSLSVVAVLVLAVGAFAATSGWFNQFLPNGVCPAGDQSCGPDFTRVGIALDHTTDVTMLNILVKPGLSRDRLTTIAQTAAAQQKTHRVIVYLLNDLPAGNTMIGGFGSVPENDAAPPLPPIAELAPFLQLTYDVGPAGSRAIWP